MQLEINHMETSCSKWEIEENLEFKHDKKKNKFRENFIGKKSFHVDGENAAVADAHRSMCSRVWTLHVTFLELLLGKLNYF